ncbi:hypothetical protein JK326_19520 [Klebsiella michiganensis]|jgi:hypothetical protein|nr:MULTISPECIES: hypothetical protein [Klebsiella/Raoultella group]HDV8890523.1 hypothetical protein [Raoultella planticola]EKR9386325.1 hypothetical protein [Raoultella ornithinolytica]MBL0785604.1 hypothetical protein [Klebsiella michiganensis]MBZ6666027.1 hypothetical protein [Klebsiella michiganensis]MBZ7222379.1 hypothetical protein [Klebsiella michiganensis]
MFRYFTLRTEQQLFCYLYGGALALFLTLLYPYFPAWAGPLLVMLPVALFWAGLALYTRHTDQMRTLEVSPLVCIRDGVQVVAMLPHHEKARLEWEILQDGEVYHQQMRDLIDLVVRLVSRGCLYAPAAILAGAGLLVWGFPQDGIRLVTALRTMPATELVQLAGIVLHYVLLISAISVLIADLVAGQGVPNRYRRALLDRLPADAWCIRRGTER